MASLAQTIGVLPAGQHHVLSILSLDSSFTVPGIIKRVYQPLDMERAHVALTTLINGGLVQEHNGDTSQDLKRFALTTQGVDALAVDRRIPRVFTQITPLRVRILSVIDDHGPCNGWGITKLSNGKISLGSVYMYLSKLEREHLLIETAVEVKKRYFSLTTLGARALTDAEKCSPIASSQLLILGALIMHGEAYGLQLCGYLQGMVSRGSIYVTLNRMIDDGLIEIARIKETLTSPPTKYYRATDHGKSVYHYWVPAEEAYL